MSLVNEVIELDRQVRDSHTTRGCPCEETEEHALVGSVPAAYEACRASASGAAEVT